MGELVATAQKTQASFEAFKATAERVLQQVQKPAGTSVPLPCDKSATAVNGSDIELTIDADTQYALQQMLSGYVTKSGAKGGVGVIMDAHTGEVYALANDKAFDPTDPHAFDDINASALGNPAVTTPYEPGSVNKIVTASAAIEYGLTRPDEVIQVPGQLRISDRVVHDAWTHGTQGFTTTGIVPKSLTA